MENKGFTLIELLAVIVIIGIVATITTPIVTGAITSSRKKACERQKDMIIDAARRWGADNNSALPATGSTTVTIRKLHSDGYLDSQDIKNPKTNQEIDPDTYVKIEYVPNKHQYTYTLPAINCS